MSSIAASSIINALVRIDQVCDYIPIVSTITNFVDIFEKCVFNSFCSSDSINSNRYFSHINDKSIFHCITLLVPILGNIIVCIYNLIQNHLAEIENTRQEKLRAKREDEERENQNVQARMLGLNVSQLPRSISKRGQIIANKQQAKRQEATEKSIQDLDKQIAGMHQSFEGFRKIIDNPDVHLKVRSYYCLFTENYNGNHQEKIHFFWLNIKLMYAYQALGNSFLSFAGLDKNETISQKQQEISELRKKISQLRQTSYRGHVQAIEKEALLQEAKKYYLESFSEGEREGIKMSIEQMTLDTILPKLKERVLAQDNNDYGIVEMQEIISQIEHI